MSRPSPPYADISWAFSVAASSGSARYALHPNAPATIARLTPVLPAVPSVIIPPGASCPDVSQGCSYARQTIAALFYATFHFVEHILRNLQTQLPLHGWKREMTKQQLKGEVRGHVIEYGVDE